MNFKPLPALKTAAPQFQWDCKKNMSTLKFSGVKVLLEVKWTSSYVTISYLGILIECHFS